MIYLIHGEDVVSSKNFLSKLSKDYTSIDSISLKNVNEIEKPLPSGKGLFSSKKLVIIENFPIRKDLKLSPELDFDVVLWFPNSVTVPKWVEKTWYFKQNQSISSFKLADCIAYGQEKQALSVLKELLKNPKETELIVGTLVRQIRLVLLYLKGESMEISSSQFVQDKVKEQARNWDHRKLKTALMYLLKTDLWLKQGKLSKETLLTNLTIDLCRLSKV